METQVSEILMFSVIALPFWNLIGFLINKYVVTPNLDYATKSDDVVSLRAFENLKYALDGKKLCDFTIWLWPITLLFYYGLRTGSRYFWDIKAKRNILIKIYSWL